MATSSIFLSFLLLCICISLLPIFTSAEDPTVSYKFEVSYITASPLGVPQQVIAINGEFPGPTINSTTNNNVVVNVRNKLDENLLLTWAGVQQKRSSWQDGVLGTNCPIPPKWNWTYNFQVKDQIGSYFYFPSLNLQRASGGFGGFVINPRSVIPVPFDTPAGDITVLIGDWYIRNHTALRKALDAGHDLGMPDGVLINGKGPYRYNDTLVPDGIDHETINVEPGKTYRIRVSNVGVSTSLNFRIQNHNLLLAESEGSYTVQQNYTSLDIHVGQTYSFLITMDQNASSDYYIVASARFVNESRWQRVTGVGILHYSNSKGKASGPLPEPPQDQYDNTFSMNQARSIRWNVSASGARPNPQGSFKYGSINVTEVYILKNKPPVTINGKKRATLSGISFVNPTTPIRLADEFKVKGAYKLDFPTEPLTGPPKMETSVINGTYRGFMEVILQNNETKMHSYHMDGYAFFVVGMGYGEWTNDSRGTYNKWDGIARATTQVYPGAWTAILISLDNVGVWNLRTENLDSWYLGQETYVRIVNPEKNNKTELPMPDNALFCGALSRMQKPQDISSALRVHGSVAIFGVLMAMLSGLTQQIFINTSLESMATSSIFLSFLLLCICISFLPIFTSAEDPTVSYKFEVSYITASPLGVPQQVIAINGEFPGPTINSTTNNNVVVNVRNKLDENLLLTWAGVQQKRSSWQDGVLGTNCPIPPKWNWTYNFQVKDQIGSYFYFPSLNLQRASGGFGGFVINPRSVIPVPFDTPAGDITVLIGDWYIRNHTALRKALDAGHDLGMPDGVLINGKGPYRYNDTLVPDGIDHETINVEPGKTYRIRVSNVGVSTSLNFRIQNHNLLLAESEGSYTVQQNYTSLDIHVGQTYSFLITMDQNASSDYYIVASARFVNESRWQRVTGVGILHYSNSKGKASGPLPEPPQDQYDNTFSMNQARSIRWNVSASGARPNPQGSFKYGSINVTEVYILKNKPPVTINGKKRATLSGISFVNPTTPIRLADEFKVKGAYKLDFPTEPLTGPPKMETSVINGTYRGFMEVILQNNETKMHSYHMDGYAFFVVGMGYGEWTNDSRGTYNKWDGIARATTQVYPGAWTAILISLDNVGVWNLRTENLDSWYLGQETYVRIVNPEKNNKTELPMPDNALFCGALSRMQKPQDISSALRVHGSVAIFGVLMATLSGLVL
uniref:Putative cupredoxin n=1 Tax=Helianthus annuus TaxID=4232 RepID=A0A251VBM3_HELAN